MAQAEKSHSPSKNNVHLHHPGALCTCGWEVRTEGNRYTYSECITKLIMAMECDDHAYILCIHVQYYVIIITIYYNNNII